MSALEYFEPVSAGDLCVASDSLVRLTCLSGMIRFGLDALDSWDIKGTPFLALEVRTGLSGVFGARISGVFGARISGDSGVLNAKISGVGCSPRRRLEDLLSGLPRVSSISVKTGLRRRLGLGVLGMDGLEAGGWASWIRGSPWIEAASIVRMSCQTAVSLISNTHLFLYHLSSYHLSSSHSVL